MADLRYTDTNAGDDSAGRAFGLEGNLYLPVVIAALVAVAVFAGLSLGCHLPYPAAALMAGVPLVGVLAWVLLLRHGKPAGHDRDWWDARRGGGDFSRPAGTQGGLR